MNTLYPISLTRKISKIFCGGTTLEEVLAEVFPKTKADFDSSLVPSFKYARAFSANKNFIWPKFEKLSDIIHYNEKILADNLEFLKKGKKQIKPRVFVGKNVKIEPNVFLDTSEGIILINDDTIIKSGAILRGPIYIGKKCVINSFAEIKEETCIGDVCKVGGEVEASIFQGYANKQHHGFLGHSYIGEWVNIGAGTTVSNLKNTYSPVKMLGEESKNIFLGCVIGDYSKTGINTAIFCGKVMGVSAHVYGMVTKDVPSFVSNVDSKNMYEMPIDVAQKIQKKVTARRGVEFSEADEHFFHKLFKLTAKERVVAKVKKSKLHF